MKDFVFHIILHSLEKSRTSKFALPRTTPSGSFFKTNVHNTWPNFGGSLHSMIMEFVLWGRGLSLSKVTNI